MGKAQNDYYPKIIDKTTCPLHKLYRCNSVQAHNQIILKGVLNLAWSHTNEKARNIKLKFKLSASKKLAKIGGSSEPLELPLVTGLMC